MQRIPAKHRALGRSVVELEAREPQLLGSILSPVLAPLVGGGTSTTPSSPQLGPSPTHGNGGGNPNHGKGSSGGVPPAPASSTTEGGSGVTPSSSPSPNSAAPAPNQSPSSSASSSSGAGGDFVGTGTSSAVPVNLASPAVPVNIGAGATSVGPDTSAPSGVATGIPVSSWPPQGVSGSNTMGIAPSATLTAAAAVSSSSRLSAGAVAGIIIVCLLGLLALVILMVRRRSIARRLELRRQWWGGHRESSGSFSFISNPRNPSPSSGAIAPSRNSARSSFATHFDQGLMFRVDSPMGTGSLGVVPEFPPMAEVRDRNSALISTGGAVVRRESLNSMLSNGSDPDAQYLSVPAGNKMEPTSPMSVRPFSPSESFSFPKPPVPQAPPSATSADSFYLPVGQALGSPQSSVDTLVHLNTPPRALISDDLPPLPTPTSPANPLSLTGSNGLSPTPFGVNPDPFVDPVKPEFANVEIIRRPFTPTLDDELAVFPGDHVRVLQAFDDGWAFVEKLAAIKFDRNERGLIPVDCLREAGQALPSFLAQKRVSSYGTVDDPATAY